MPFVLKQRGVGTRLSSRVRNGRVCRLASHVRIRLAKQSYAKVLAFARDFWLFERRPDDVRDRRTVRGWFLTQRMQRAQRTQRSAGLVFNAERQRRGEAEGAGLGASRNHGKPAGRGAICDGLGRGPAGGPVNKFPAANGALPQPLAGLSSPRRIGKPAVPAGQEIFGKVPRRLDV